MTENDVEFFRPLDYFAVQVCQRRDLDRNSQLGAAWSYRQTYGLSALVTALEAAARVEPLPGCLAKLLDALRSEAAAWAA